MPLLAVKTILCLMSLALKPNSLVCITNSGLNQATNHVWTILFEFSNSLSSMPTLKFMMN